MPKNHIGFTLIEILVAIGIMGLVAVVAIPNLRNFNEDQLLRNASLQVMQSIRQTQTNAQANIVCPQTKKASKNWSFLVASSTSYRLQVECLTSTGLDDTSEIIDPVSISPLNITTNCSSGGVANKITYSRYSVLIDGQSCTVTINNPQTSQNKVITINKGGAIY